MTELVLLGVNHKTAPLGLRERLAIPSGEIPAALRKAVEEGFVSEGLILSTCNRVEVYAGLTPDGDARERMRLVVHALTGVDPADLGDAAYVRLGRDVVEHLFCVACGLDSLVLGETQILGQVREAFSDAAAAGSTGPVFNRLFHHALRVGKRARAESSIAAGINSVPSAAVHTLARHLGGLRGRIGVLLGAGAMAGMAASHLASQGLAELFVVNRTLSRAEALTATWGGRAVPLDGLEDAVHGADFVVAASAAPGYQLRADSLSGRWRDRGDRRLLAVDLSVPRVIDPAIAGLDGVTVYDLDALDRLLEAHRARRAEAVERVEHLVAEEVDAFVDWWRERHTVSPVLAALAAHCDAVRRHALERNLKFLVGVEPDRVDRFTRSLLAKFLDHPLRKIRSWRPDTPEVLLRLQVVRELFGLEEDGGSVQDLFEAGALLEKID